MKPTEKEIRIVQRMQPGVITLNGFLGDDNRPLNEIIADDGAVLTKLGYEPSELAARMDFFTQASWEGYLDGLLIEDNFQVQTEVYRGKLPCPFSHVGIYRKAITYLTNIKNGITVTWTSLSIHLIKEHGFFEGKGSVFRLEPEILVRALFEK